MSTLDQKSLESLDALVNSIVSKVIKETLSPLQGETEEDRQDTMAKELRALKSAPRGSKRKAAEDEDLDEAEDEEKKDVAEDETEESPEPEEKKPSEFVSKKIATGKEEPKTPKAVIPDPTEVRDVTFGQVVNIMNMMRSGKSAKDPETKKKLGAYFKGLNPGERQALFVLMSGITQILAGGVEGEDAPDPAQVGIKIHPRPAKKDAAAEPTDKAKVSSKTPTASVSGRSEDESLPIVVGEMADRSRILQRISRLRTRK